MITTVLWRWLRFRDHRRVAEREEEEEEERECECVSQIQRDISTHACCVPFDLDPTVQNGLDETAFSIKKVGSE